MSLAWRGPVVRGKVWYHKGRPRSIRYGLGPGEHDLWNGLRRQDLELEGRAGAWCSPSQDTRSA